MASLSAGLLLEAGFWIVLSLVAGGLIHEFLDRERIQAAMRKSGAASMAAALALGATLPICSCGVIPLTVSFFLGGVRLAVVIAFTIATPVINPAAVVLSWALLGPQLTLVYVAFGLVAPAVVGIVTERWGGSRMNPVATRLQSCCCPGPVVEAAASPTALPARLRRALKWGFGELGPELGLYIGIGIALAGITGYLVPAGWISDHLGGGAPFVSLLLVALLGASLYVCAVAHIPLVAAMLAAGAGPGAAIVFLVTGAATNLPEIIALQRVLGARTVAIYVGGVVTLSLVAGWLVNLWLPDYRPVLDPLASLDLSDIAASLTPIVPLWLASASALVVGVLAAWGAMQWLSRTVSQARFFPSHGR
ncbi:MAG: permease [Burkholderiales bacterium]